MHFQTPPNSTRGSTPDSEDKDELRPHTTGLSHRLKQDSPPVLGSTTSSHSPSRHIDKSLKRARSPSLDSTYDSSDDGITEPITPPPILRELSRFVKRAKTDPKPYQRDVADAIDSLFLENRLRPDDPVELERDLQQLSPQAVAQAVVTMHAEVEFRRVRALARAHEINATSQRLRLLHMVLEDEGEVYANAASEPLDTSVEEIFKYKKNRVPDSIGQGIATYSQDVMSFAVADSHLDCFEGTARMLLDKSKLDGSAEACLVYSRPGDSINVVEAQITQQDTHCDAFMRVQYVQIIISRTFTTLKSLFQHCQTHYRINQTYPNCGIHQVIRLFRAITVKNYSIMNFMTESCREIAKVVHNPKARIDECTQASLNGPAGDL
ncbi:hypothetical protein EDD22DRAFT_853895 [Suillus occidentalis]|nr:hypothetical protein EDD22DRAFT_853895 [Suillus occidentalis]